MDPLRGLAYIAEKIAKRALEKLTGNVTNKSWDDRERLAAIFRKYAYEDIQTLQLSQKPEPDKKNIRREIDKLSDFLQRNEKALREIAELLSEPLTPNFGEFNRYRELENYRTKLKEKVADETDDLKQLQINAEIKLATQQIEQLKKTVLDFAETITNIPNLSVRQIEARRLFFAGDLDAARILLEDSREEMQDIKSRALAAKTKNESELAFINKKLEEIANDYLLLAQATAANSGEFAHYRELELNSDIAVKAFLTYGNKTHEGTLITGVSIAWDEIVRMLTRNPNAIHEIDPWKLEEIVAGAYQREGWQVVLTPRSGDHGRDIIATRDGLGSIRIVDQIKRYRIGRPVQAKEVREMAGVLLANPGYTKGIITTTSTFAPRLLNDHRIADLIPYRLELRDKMALLPWLKSLGKI